MISKILVVGAVVMFTPHLAHAISQNSVTITNSNSSLRFTIDKDSYNHGLPNDPVQFPRTLEWVVDGRRILVYPSAPSGWLDIEHLHPAMHVAGNQMHAQGPFFGYGTSPIAGSVTGGIVYSVHGGMPGSFTSRISEKVRIHNKSSGNLDVTLIGLGSKSGKATLEVSDFAGLNITGTTVVYYQGNNQTGQLTDGPPFAPMTVFPLVSFSGFNPFRESLTLPPGAFLIMITELKISSSWIVIQTWWLLGLVAVIGIVVAMAMIAYRRRGQ
jgi:hypothetical protein